MQINNFDLVHLVLHCTHYKMLLLLVEMHSKNKIWILFINFFSNHPTFNDKFSYYIFGAIMWVFIDNRVGKVRQSILMAKYLKLLNFFLEHHNVCMNGRKKSRRKIFLFCMLWHRNSFGNKKVHKKFSIHKKAIIFNGCSHRSHVACECVCVCQMTYSDCDGEKN